MKTDVVFVQQLPMPYFGILAMDAFLKKSGYRDDVLIDAYEKDLTGTLARLSPSVIGLSVFSTEHRWLVEAIRRIRTSFPATPIVVGGVHGLIYPEEILTDTLADLVCCGDGEETIVRIIKESEKALPRWETIPGIAYRQDRASILTTPAARPVPYSADTIEDRALYFTRYPRLSHDKIGLFLSSRGCPHACSFCYNTYLRSRSLDPKNYLRQKGVDDFIEEITRQTARVKYTMIYFLDDMFTFNVAWLRLFLKKYQERVGLPFVCNTRADQMTDEIAELLSGAGCTFASFGIETGNARIRSTILAKKITDDQIVHAAALLHRHRIGVRTSNMFCLPTETVSDALATVELNIRIHAESASSTLLLPYPKTAIHDYCQKSGLFLTDYTLYDMPHITQRTSVLDMPHKHMIFNCHYLLYWFARYPWTYRIGKGLVYQEWLSGLFHLCYLAGYFIRNKNENGLGWFGSLRYAWRKRTLVFGMRRRS
ncbi:MAG: radical SAM protein [Candidatus Omnitrophota bacterium]